MTRAWVAILCLTRSDVVEGSRKVAGQSQPRPAIRVVLREAIELRLLKLEASSFQALAFRLLPHAFLCRCESFADFLHLSGRGFSRDGSGERIRYVSCGRLTLSAVTNSHEYYLGSLSSFRNRID